jgi:hypothetical protein
MVLSALLGLVWLLGFVAPRIIQPARTSIDATAEGGGPWE